MRCFFGFSSYICRRNDATPLQVLHTTLHVDGLSASRCTLHVDGLALHIVRRLPHVARLALHVDGLSASRAEIVFFAYPAHTSPNKFAGMALKIRFPFWMAVFFRCKYTALFRFLVLPRQIMLFIFFCCDSFAKLDITKTH